VHPLVNAIKNGDFEVFSTGNNNSGSAVADYWLPYQNDGAHFGFYDEEWPEAVHSGRHSQLMEIHRVESFRRERAMAIYQTVEVIPNRNYLLTIQALMRSDAPPEDRNQGEYAMHWGIDVQGRGKYHFIENWVEMPLVEQQRLGSSGPPEDNTHLFYQHITATVATGNSNKLTLFIRGMKIEPTGTELNFNIDDVSLIGPYLIPTATPTPSPTFTRRPTLTPTPTPTLTATPPGLPITGQEDLPEASERIMPDAGGILPKNISTGALILGGLILIVLGAGAVANLLLNHKK
jgi:hypothetical protein